MRRIILVLLTLLISVSTAFAERIPNDVKQYVENIFPKTNFRFDGVVILPDATIYLPLFPAKPTEVEKIQVKSTIPEKKAIETKPEAIIFNNGYVLLKIIPMGKNQKTVISPTVVPAEITNGLLPQDMLVPSGLIIPENLKGIIGNLNIGLTDNTNLKIDVPQSKNPAAQNKIIPAEPLKDKTFYVVTGYSKNIQVINSENKSPAYALKQAHVPNNIKGYKNQYLLVTSYDSKIMNVISLQEEDIVKQFHFDTQPDEILIDTSKDIAYVSSAEGSSIYVINLDSMTFSKQIKINGMCERLTLSDDGTKLFYVDKKNNNIWAIELDNNYLLKDIGKFPNVSKIAFHDNKIYITSRTKAHLAIIDYETNGVIAEIQIADKPVDMIAYNHKLYILGATENIVQVIDTETDDLTDTIYLNTEGFSTNINRIEDTNYAIISDTRASIYCVLDLETKQIVKASAIEVPIRNIVVTDKVIKTK